MKRLFWVMIRLLTLPCILNEALLLLLRFRCSYFDPLSFWLLSVTMVLIPVSGYLIGFKRNKDDNENRRKTAMLCSMLGYCSGTALLFLLERPAGEKTILLTYLVSGLLISVLSLVKVRASGHAAGIAGPFFIAAFLRTAPMWLLIPLFVLIFGLVFEASLRLKRHKAYELLLGAFCPVAAFLVLTLLQ